jgi:2-polyprenyl-3-methyl-5-hydroxy-6-metoxy-1,4-benzoquinol methylase
MNTAVATDANREFFRPEDGFSRSALGVLAVPGSPTFAYGPAPLLRVNARAKAILLPIADEIKGKRILDLGAHDGRWSWGALKLGASHATAIEWRQAAIDFGLPLFRGMEDRYRPIQGEIFEVLSKLHESYDIIFNLGIFYHIMDHYRLLRSMRDMKPSLIVLDTGLIDVDESFIRLEMEDTSHIMNAAADPGNVSGKNVIGFVSRGALRLMCESLGLSVQYVPWVAEEHPDKGMIEDYFPASSPVGKKRRFTIHLRPI